MRISDGVQTCALPIYAELVGCSQVGDRRARGDCTVRDGKPEPVGDRLRKRRIDVEQMRHDPRTDIGPLDLGEFEHKGVADMLLLDRRLAYEEPSRQAVMVGEGFRTPLLFGTVGGLRATGAELGRGEGRGKV